MKLYNKQKFGSFQEGEKWTNLEHKENTGQAIWVGYEIVRVPEYTESAKSAENSSWLAALLGLMTAGIDAQTTVKFRYLKLRNENVRLLLLAGFTTSNYETCLLDFPNKLGSMLPDTHIFKPLSESELEITLNSSYENYYEVRRKVLFEELNESFQHPVVPPLFVLSRKNNEGLNINFGSGTYAIPFVSPIRKVPFQWELFLRWCSQQIGNDIQFEVVITSQPCFRYERSLSRQYLNMVMELAHASKPNSYAQFDQKDLINIALRKFNGSEPIAGVQFLFSSSRNSIAETAAHCYIQTLNSNQPNYVALEVVKRNVTPGFGFSPSPLSKSTLTVAPQAVPFIQRLQYIYTSNESEYLCQLPFSLGAALPRINCQQLPPFSKYLRKTSYYNEEGSIKKIHLGNLLINQGVSLEKVEIDIDSLTKHTAIFGQPGSGKTNTMMGFIAMFMKEKIPFLVIEPSSKSEYFDQIEKLGIQVQHFNFDNPFYISGINAGCCNPNFLRFNPLIPKEGLTINEHIAYIKAAFLSAAPAPGIIPMVFELILKDFYKNKLHIDYEYLFLDFSKHDYEDYLDGLTLLQLSEFISLYFKENAKLFPDELQKDFDSALNRRLQRLTHRGSIFGQAFCPEYWIDYSGDEPTRAQIPNILERLFEEPTIIELASLPDEEEKTLVSALLLSFVFEKRKVEGLSPILKHALIIEEAHRLLAGSVKTSGYGEEESASLDSRSKTLSLFIDMLKEVRAYGEGVFVIDQSPTSVNEEVLKNTNLKLVHRLPSKIDREMLGNSMRLTEDQKQYTAGLAMGEVIAFGEVLGTSPYLMKVQKFT